MTMYQMTQAFPQVNNLPVPADRFIEQPMQPNIASPVFATAVSDDPNIRPYSQQILWSLANEIVGSVTRVQANALRVFSFNLYAQANFNNQEFFSLGVVVAARVRLGLMRSEFPNIDVAIATLVPETVTIVIGANGRRFDALLSYCTPDQQGHVLAAASRYDAIVNDINRASTGVSVQQQPMQGALTGQIAGGYQSTIQNSNVFAGIGNTGQLTNNQPANNAIAPMPSIPAPSKPVEQMSALERQAYETTLDNARRATEIVNNNHVLNQYNPGTPSASSNLAGQYSVNPVIDAHTPVAPQNATVVHVGANAPAYAHPSAEVHAQQVVQAFTAPAVQEAVSEMVNPPSNPYSFSRVEIIGTPDDVQSSRSVKKESESGARYEVTIAGKTYAIATAHNYGEVTWQPSAIQPFHPLVSLNTQNVFYIELETGEIIAMIQNLQEGKYHMNYDEHAVYGSFADKAPKLPSGKPQEKPQYMDLEVPKMKVIQAAGVQNYFSAESAVSESYLHAVGQFKLTKDENPLAATYETRLLTPIVFDDVETAQNVRDIITNLGGFANFAAVAAELQDIEDVRIRNIVNKFLTQRVCDAFKFELSVTYNAIDNFINDHADLLTVINDNFPGSIAETFNTHQQRIIRTACHLADVSKIENLSDYYGVEADSAKDLIDRSVFIARNTAIAVCNFNDSDLAPFFAEESCAVLETTHPHLREILSRTLNTKTLSQKSITQTHIITRDGHRYLASKSMVANGAVLLRRA